MTLSDGFERTVSDWLDDQAGHGMPGYLDEILARTTHIRQRPAWSSLERWLPMRSTLRFAAVPRIAWLLVTLALIVALGVAIVVVGSRPRLAPPFGLAGNGVVAFGSADGDIYAFDPVSGSSRPLIAGPAKDETPWFSRDGTRFVFARESAEPDRWTLMVANADGSDMRPLTGPIYPTGNEWSPDGSQLAVIDAAPATPTMTIYHLDGSSPTPLDLDGIEPAFAMWRPDGHELVFRGVRDDLYRLYAIDVVTKDVRPIGSMSTTEDGLRDTYLSPDGQKVVYMRWVRDHPTIRIIDVDTGDDREVLFDGVGGATTDGWATWSPDGSKLAFTRLHEDGNRIAVGSVDGGRVTELGQLFTNFTDGVSLDFSPDGSKVIARYGFDGSTWVLDVAGLEPDQRLPTTDSLGTWQRLAQ